MSVPGSCDVRTDSASWRFWRESRISVTAVLICAWLGTPDTSTPRRSLPIIEIVTSFGGGDSAITRNTLLLSESSTRRWSVCSPEIPAWSSDTGCPPTHASRDWTCCEYQNDVPPHRLKLAEIESPIAV